MKPAGRKITVLTAYDYPTARILDATDIEGILVGDSLSMVVQGHANTLPVTLEEMIYHAEMVGRAVTRALVIVDMPFPSFHLGTYRAIESAGRMLKETRCQAVKLEGGVEQAETIAGLVAAGIPVMAHVGLRPQSVHQLGGYRVQRDEKQLLADARAAE
ncbi:MAG: 3-methyl-2-oxobutanoate hydroxymethyltransferase, partial [Patescibacteria group bacterium]|nr:3-methyl-2-oxobutanoate hydroxymethyltransferase [Patescibacteria group bacterium]